MGGGDLAAEGGVACSIAAGALVLTIVPETCVLAGVRSPALSCGSAADASPCPVLGGHLLSLAGVRHSRSRSIYGDRDFEVSSIMRC